MRDEITVELYERGQWVKHGLPLEIAKEIYSGHGEANGIG